MIDPSSSLLPPTCDLTRLDDLLRLRISFALLPFPFQNHITSSISNQQQDRVHTHAIMNVLKLQRYESYTPGNPRPCLRAQPRWS